MTSGLKDLTPEVTATDHSVGPAQASITLVEFGDFECPQCKTAAPVVKLLLARYADRLRFVFRNFPLEEVHPRALDAAHAAECAGAQGRFWPMHVVLFEHLHSLDRPQLYSYAESLALDMGCFDAEMKHMVYLQRIREHQASGRASGVRATPTFFLNGVLVDASFGLGSLSEAIDRELRTLFDRRYSSHLH